MKFSGGGGGSVGLAPTLAIIHRKIRAYEWHPIHGTVNVECS